MVSCLNKASKEYKSWEEAGFSKKDIYTEYVLNNYVLPTYKKNYNRATTFKELGPILENYRALKNFGIKTIDTLSASVDAMGAFMNDTLYFGKLVDQKTISEETGHAMLQRFVDEKTYNILIEAGRNLLIKRLGEEGRTLDKYREELEKKTGVSKENSLRYASEEEIIKDFVLYDISGTLAEDLRYLNKLKAKLSFLPRGEIIAKTWFNVIKGLKNLLNLNNVQKGFDKLIKLRTQEINTVPNNRGYNVPSYLFMRSSFGNGISGHNIATVINDTVATYNYKFGEFNSSLDFDSKIEEVLRDLENYYDTKIEEALEAETSIQGNPNTIYYTELQDVARDVLKLTKALPGENISPKKEFIRQVKFGLKNSGVDISKEYVEEDESDVNKADDDKALGENYDFSPNQFSPESLSLGLKSIILKAGKKETFEVGGKEVTIVLAPNTENIYNGFVRFVAKYNNDLDRFVVMVKFASIDVNTSSKLLMDYYLEQFIEGATYNDSKIESIEDWINIIKNKKFDVELLVIKDGRLSQEITTLLKGLALTKRNLSVFSTELVEGKNGENLNTFDFYDSDINNYTKTTFKDLARGINTVRKQRKNLEVFQENLKNTKEAYGLYSTEQAFLVYTLKQANDLSRTQIEFTKDIIGKILDNNFVTNNLDTVYKNFLSDGKFLEFTDEKSESEDKVNNRFFREVLREVYENTESIANNTLKNIKGDTIYPHQRNTPILYFFKNLTKDFINTASKMNPYKGQSNKFSDISFKNNSYLKHLSKSSNLNPFKNTYMLDGVIIKSNNSKIAFSDMSESIYTASLLNHALASLLNPKNKVDGTYLMEHALGQNEASNQMDFVASPIYDVFKEFRNLINTEVERVDFAKSVINDIVKFKNHTNGTIQITYDDILEYGQLNELPSYQGYLEGNYNVVEGVVNYDFEGSQASPKAFTIAANLNGIVDYNNLYTITDEELSKSINKELNEQFDYITKIGSTKLLSSQFSKETSFLQDKDGKPLEYKEKVKFIIAQYWLASTYTNQAITGDFMLSFKNDNRDILKRHRVYNAAIIGVENIFNIPRYGIKPKTSVRFLTYESVEKEMLGATVAVDDAQSLASLEFWKYKKLSKGELNDTIYDMYKKVQAGETIDIEDIEKHGFYIPSDKTVGAIGEKVIKHSEHTIIPSSVAKIILVEGIPKGYTFEAGILKPIVGAELSGYFVGYISKEGKQIINQLIPLSAREELFNKYAILNGWINDGVTLVGTNSIDLRIPVTALKGAKVNVLSRDLDYHDNPEYFISEIDADKFGDQLNNPQGKTSILDPSQNQDIRPSEIDSPLTKEFIDNHVKRHQFEIDLILRILYGKNYKKEKTLQAKEFYDSLKNSLTNSGSTSQKLNLLDIQRVENTFLATYNKNLPVIRKEFTEFLFKYFTKALKQKVKGSAYVQVSSLGYNVIKKIVIENGITSWKVVTQEEYDLDLDKFTIKGTNKSNLADLQYDGLDLINGKGTQLTDYINSQIEGVTQTAYFFDKPRFRKPKFKADGTFDFYVSETILPARLSDGRIPNHLLYQYGVRIPSQDKQTSIAIEWISTIDAVYGNTIIVPEEFVHISGSDFDIDKLYVQEREGYYKEGEFVEYTSSFEDFKRYMHDKKIINDRFLNSREESNEIETFNSKIAELKKEKKNSEFSINDLKSLIKETSQLLNDSRKQFLNNLININLDNLSSKKFSSKLNKLLDNSYKAVQDLSNFNTNTENPNYEEINKLKEIASSKLLELKDLVKNNYKEFTNNQASMLEDSIYFLEKDLNTYNGYKEILKQQFETRKELNKLYQEREEFSNKLKLEILEELGLPVTEEEYNKQSITIPPIINNRQLDISFQLLSNDKVSNEIYTNPASVDLFRDLENATIQIRLDTTNPKELDILKKYEKDTSTKIEDGVATIHLFKVNGVSVFSSDKKPATFSIQNFGKYKKDILIGQGAVGIIANFNIYAIGALKWNLISKIPVKYNGEQLAIQTLTFDNQRVFSAISAAISVATDEAKENILANYGMTTTDLKVLSSMILHGIPYQQAFSLVQSKGAKKYSNLLEEESFTEFINSSEKVKEQFTASPVNITNTFAINGNEQLQYDMYYYFNTFYKSLSVLKPIFKLKNGTPNQVEELLDLKSSINDIERAIYLDATGELGGLSYLNIASLENNQEFKDLLKIAKEVVETAESELIEFKPIYGLIQRVLNPYINISKKEFKENIIQFVDNYLVKDYFGQYDSLRPLTDVNYVNTITPNIIKGYYALIKDADSSSGSKQALDAFNALITFKKSNNTNKAFNANNKNEDVPFVKNITLNREGKLNSLVKENFLTNFRILEASQNSNAKQLAKLLFEYYIVTDGLYASKSSLDLMFPPNYYKDLSSIYDTIQAKEGFGTDIEKIYKEFIVAFLTNSTHKYLNNYKYLKDIFAPYLKANQKLGQITTKVNGLDVITVDPELAVVPFFKLNDKVYIKVGESYYQIAVKGTRYNTEFVIQKEEEKILPGNTQVSMFYDAFEVEYKDEVVEFTDVAKDNYAEFLVVNPEVQNNINKIKELTNQASNSHFVIKIEDREVKLLVRSSEKVAENNGYLKLIAESSNGVTYELTYKDKKVVSINNLTLNKFYKKEDFEVIETTTNIENILVSRDIKPVIKREKEQKILDRINSFQTVGQLEQAWNSDKFTEELKKLYKEDFSKRKLEISNGNTLLSKKISSLQGSTANIQDILKTEFINSKGFSVLPDVGIAIKENGLNIEEINYFLDLIKSSEKDVFYANIAKDANVMVTTEGAFWDQIQHYRENGIYSDKNPVPAKNTKVEKNSAYSYYITDKEGNPITPVSKKTLNILSKIFKDDLHNIIDASIGNIYFRNTAIGLHKDTTEPNNNIGVYGVVLGNSYDLQITTEQTNNPVYGSGAGTEVVLNLKQGDIYKFGLNDNKNTGRFITHRPVGNNNTQINNNLNVSLPKLNLPAVKKARYKQDSVIIPETTIEEYGLSITFRSIKETKEINYNQLNSDIEKQTTQPKNISSKSSEFAKQLNNLVEEVANKVKKQSNNLEIYTFKDFAKENKGKRVTIKYDKYKTSFTGVITGNTQTGITGSDKKGEYKYIGVEIKTNTGKLVTANPFYEIEGVTGIDKLTNESNKIYTNEVKGNEIATRNKLVLNKFTVEEIKSILKKLPNQNKEERFITLWNFAAQGKYNPFLQIAGIGNINIKGYATRKNTYEAIYELLNEFDADDVIAKLEKEENSYGEYIDTFKNLEEKFVSDNTNKQQDTLSTMTDILTEKLKQHPELIQGINERGGLAYIEQSTYNVNQSKLVSKASIPQNLVSGVEAFGTKQEANLETKKLLGNSPHSIDMIEAGLRTRTTRSVGEMQKYNINVGDVVTQFGKSADGTTKQILTIIIAIHPKGTPGFLGTWSKEGWTQEGIEYIKRFKDGAAAIEFEIVNTIEDNFWESTGQNKFIEALSQAYENVISEEQFSPDDLGIVTSIDKKDVQCKLKQK